MNKLKELRQQNGMRQREVAERLGTTQQTVARWETGQVSMPTDQLVALAGLFNCRLDDLLETQATAQQADMEGKFVNREGGEPFGTLVVRFSFGERSYPVDEEEWRHVRDQADHDNPFEERVKSIDFTTLDNRIVFLNIKHVRGVRAVSMAVEQMPYFAPREVYRHLILKTPLDELHPSLMNYWEELLQALAPGLTGDDALHRARAQLISPTYIEVDGTVRSGSLSSSIASELSVLLHHRPDNPNVNRLAENVLMQIRDEPDDSGFELANLDWIAAIEMPNMALGLAIFEDLPD